jgi:hypothetical protein
VRCTVLRSRGSVGLIERKARLAVVGSADPRNFKLVCSERADLHGLCVSMLFASSVGYISYSGRVRYCEDAQIASSSYQQLHPSTVWVVQCGRHVANAMGMAMERGTATFWGCAICCSELCAVRRFGGDRGLFGFGLICSAHSHALCVCEGVRGVLALPVSTGIGLVPMMRFVQAWHTAVQCAAVLTCAAAELPQHSHPVPWFPTVEGPGNGTMGGAQSRLNGVPPTYTCAFVRHACTH